MQNIQTPNKSFASFKHEQEITNFLFENSKISIEIG